MPSRRVFLRLNQVVVWACAIAIGVALLAVFTYSILRRQAPGDSALAISGADRLMLRALLLIACLWVFALGACIASFVNVVAFRLPRGRSILGVSCCPYCLTRLGLLENLPIIGWIALNGRCKTCRLPISPRYLVVEVLLGTIFLALATAELLYSGANLPGFIIDRNASFAQVILLPQWDLIGCFALHAYLFSAMLIVGLIRGEGLTVPISLGVVLVAIACLAVALWPQLLPISFDGRLSFGKLLPWYYGPANAALGLLSGAMFGLAFGLAVRRRTQPRRNEYFWPVALLGTCLGWQAAINVTVAAAVVVAMAPRAGAKDGTLVYLMMAASLFQVLCWNLSASAWWLATGGAPWYLWLAQLVVALFLTRAAAVRSDRMRRLS